MKDENGKILTEGEKIKEALEHLSEACCFLFETESDAANALAFMVDAALKYGQVIYRGDNVLMAAADYNAYEENRCEEK